MLERQGLDRLLLCKLLGRSIVYSLILMCVRWHNLHLRLGYHTRLLVLLLSNFISTEMPTVALGLLLISPCWLLWLNSSRLRWLWIFTLVGLQTVVIALVFFRSYEEVPFDNFQKEELKLVEIPSWDSAHACNELVCIVGVVEEFWRDQNCSEYHPKRQVKWLVTGILKIFQMPTCCFCVIKILLTCELYSC